MSMVSLIGLGFQSLGIAFKKRHIKVGFFLSLKGLLVGVRYFYTFGTFGKFLVI